MSIVMNYEAMFGSESELITDRLMPDILPVTIRESVIHAACAAAKKQKQWLLIFVIGTKPCFYKFWGAITAAEARGLPYLVINAGQHYDAILTHGTREFGYDDRIAAHLSIRGDLAQKAGELIFKMSWLARYLKKQYPAVTAVPVVLGDTVLTTAVPMAWMFSAQHRALHNEAGLRSMAPVVMRDLKGNVPLAEFFERQVRGGWDLMTSEPFPEQYDTFTASAGCQYLFAPLEINRRHLIREGYRPENIFVTGGVVVDALHLKLKERPTKSIFELYPALKSGEWIRVDVHRKENLTSRRLAAIVGGVSRLVRKGYRVNFVEMNATRSALEETGLSPVLARLRRFKNFLYTPVWPEYVQVLEFYRSTHCLLAMTDSGGLQEELNMIGKPCLTLRFNTDRPETVTDGGGNLLVPPVSPEFVAAAADFVCSSPRLLQQLAHPAPLYGADAGATFIAIVEKLMRRRARLYTWAQEELGLWKEK